MHQKHYFNIIMSVEIQANRKVKRDDEGHSNHANWPGKIFDGFSSQISQ